MHHTHLIPIPHGFSILDAYTELSIFGHYLEPFSPLTARYATILSRDLTCELCGTLVLS